MPGGCLQQFSGSGSYFLRIPVVKDSRGVQVARQDDILSNLRQCLANIHQRAEVENLRPGFEHFGQMHQLRPAVVQHHRELGGDR